MKKKTYSEKLLDPKWQKKRLTILNRDDWSCRFCHDRESTLHVHHTYYETGLEPWEYEDHTLLTLCHVCHGKETKHSYKANKVLGSMIDQCGFSVMHKLHIAAGFKILSWDTDRKFSNTEAYLFIAQLLASPHVFQELIKQHDELFTGEHYEVSSQALTDATDSFAEEIFSTE